MFILPHSYFYSQYYNLVYIIPILNELCLENRFDTIAKKGGMFECFHLNQIIPKERTLKY